MATKKETVVVMADGRNVTFPGRRKMQVEATLDSDNFLHVLLDFINGKSAKFLAAPKDLANFVIYGAIQKFRDNIAGVTEIDDIVTCSEELITRLEKGEWVAKREAGSGNGASILQKALMEFYGCDAEKIRNFLSDKTQAEKMAMRNNDKIKPIIQRLEDERDKKAASTGIDTDSLLDSFGKEPAFAEEGEPDHENDSPDSDLDDEDD